MFEIIKNVINSKDYKLEDMLYKISNCIIVSGVLILIQIVGKKLQNNNKYKK